MLILISEIPRGVPRDGVFQHGAPGKNPKILSYEVQGVVLRGVCELIVRARKSACVIFGMMCQT